MRKFLVLLSIFAVIACEDEKEGEQVCTNKLWNLTETCSNNPNTGEETCNWLATYGQTQASANTVTVDQSTYDHYVELGNVTDGSICWEGTQD